MSRRREGTRGAPDSMQSVQEPHKPLATAAEQAEKAPSSLLPTALYHSLDLGYVLSLVFGGCCANVWTYEELTRMNPRIGSALTFSQMLFIALQALPTFLERQPNAVLPRLARPHVPMRRWAVQVVLLTAGSLLNNWVFKYDIPLTIQIVFRSAGLAVSMLFGYLFRGRSYNFGQVASVLLVSAGVTVSALSRPQGSRHSADDLAKYGIGIVMLVASLVLSGMLGMLQEQTYQLYGPYWKEGVFYTHALSLPIFVFLIQDIKDGFRSLSTPSYKGTRYPDDYVALLPYMVLLANLVTQTICVSGVNQLTSRVSSVSTNLALTVRKALSLCFSVWWFGSGWNARFAMGASMVFSGSLAYAAVGQTSTHSNETEPAGPAKGSGKEKVA